MKRLFILLSVIGLSACQQISSMKLCGFGSGLERFESCSLDTITDSNSAWYKSFHNEIKSEYGTQGDGQAYVIEQAWFGTLINGAYFPGEESTLREIKEKTGIDSFSRVRELTDKCNSFNEYSYRNKLQTQYGKKGEAQIE